MTTFRISVGDQVDYVKAKHIHNGRYLCRNITTGNVFGVKWIGTLRDDNSVYYAVTQLYEPALVKKSSKFKVTKID